MLHIKLQAYLCIFISFTNLKKLITASSLLRILIIASLIANWEPPTYLKYRQLGNLFPMNHVNRKDLRKEFTFQLGLPYFKNAINCLET